jgi:hypothetical protein
MTTRFKTQKLSNGGFRIDGARGGCAAWFDGPIMQMAAWGHGEGALAKAFLAEVDTLVSARESIVVFNDLDGLTSYDPAYRATFDAWGVKTKDQVPTVHILVRSKLVAMAIAVFALFEGGRVRPYSRRSEWEKVLREHGGTVVDASKRQGATGPYSAPEGGG